MPKFLRKPTVIEAEQFLLNAPLPFKDRGAVLFDGENYYIETMHDKQIVILEDGDWIVPESDGKHFYPIKSDVFKQTYTPVGG